MDDDFEMDEAELERMEEEMMAEQAAAKSGQPEPQLDQDRAQKELQGRQKKCRKGRHFY